MKTADWWTIWPLVTLTVRILMIVQSSRLTSK